MAILRLAAVDEEEARRSPLLCGDLESSDPGECTLLEDTLGLSLAGADESEDNGTAD